MLILHSIRECFKNFNFCSLKKCHKLILSNTLGSGPNFEISGLFVQLSFYENDQKSLVIGGAPSFSIESRGFPICACAPQLVCCKGSQWCTDEQVSIEVFLSHPPHTYSCLKGEDFSNTHGWLTYLTKISRKWQKAFEMKLSMYLQRHGEYLNRKKRAFEILWCQKESRFQTLSHSMTVCDLLCNINDSVYVGETAKAA